MNRTLAHANKGESCIIIDFADESTKCQTMRFGLSKGETIKCLEKVGPIIVGKSYQKLAIGKNLASKIYVKTA